MSKSKNRKLTATQKKKNAKKTYTASKIRL